MIAAPRFRTDHPPLRAPPPACGRGCRGRRDPRPAPRDGEGGRVAPARRVGLGPARTITATGPADPSTWPPGPGQPGGPPRDPRRWGGGGPSIPSRRYHGPDADPPSVARRPPRARRRGGLRLVDAAPGPSTARADLAPAASRRDAPPTRRAHARRRVERPGSRTPPPVTNPWTTETEWGTILDAVPTTFPRLPGRRARRPARGAGQRHRGSPAAAWTRSRLVPRRARGARLVTRSNLSSPLEDGTPGGSTSGSDLPECRIQTTFRPADGSTMIIVLYGAGCRRGA